MPKERLRVKACELGFEQMTVCSLPDYSGWRERVNAMPDKHFTALTDDVQSVFPGACSAVLLIRPYSPYEYPKDVDTATVSAYYPASDAGHHAVLELADWLCHQGYRAVGSPNIPFKPIASRNGIARYGRNGITGTKQYGTRYTLQVLLTDAPLEIDTECEDSDGLSDHCIGCDRCVRACPTGALDGTGRVDVYRCIRAVSDEYPMKEEFRSKIGRSLYGCDICQDVCPRNRGIAKTQIPEELRASLRLETLLAGNVNGLIPYVGKNYARKARAQAKACVIAANLKRTDLLSSVEALRESPVDFVRVHSEWAVKELVRHCGDRSTDEQE